MDRIIETDDMTIIVKDHGYSTITMQLKRTMPLNRARSIQFRKRNKMKNAADSDEECSVTMMNELKKKIDDECNADIANEVWNIMKNKVPKINR